MSDLRKDPTRGRWVLVRPGPKRPAASVCPFCPGNESHTPHEIFAYRTESMWTAVLLIGLAAAAHQGFSANLLTLPSDMFPTRAVASVVGIGGMAGALGGMLIAKVVGYVLQSTGSYMVPFLIAGSAYLVALASIQILTPRIEPVKIENG